ncbi:hypothetical protein NIES4074_43490 [Cylindrospermum sp. NIES-4074]|nr:hypothetical protein NIES4074_43490 [Cylindrospermum sp. NIES-4074]
MQPTILVEKNEIKLQVVIDSGDESLEIKCERFTIYSTEQQTNDTYAQALILNLHIARSNENGISHKSYASFIDEEKVTWDIINSGENPIPGDNGWRFNLKKRQEQ